MRPTFGPSVLLASLIGWPSASLAAASIEPDGIVYSVNAEENEEVKICEIVLDLKSPVTPEVVEMRTFTAYGKSDDTASAGFIVFAGRKGADEIVPLKVRKATFTAQSFRSAQDMDYEIQEDVGIMSATVDPDKARSFLTSFAAGDFEIAVAVSQPETSTVTYKISAGPPVEVQENFGQCIDSLVPQFASTGH